MFQTDYRVVAVDKENWQSKLDKLKKTSGLGRKEIFLF